MQAKPILEQDHHLAVRVVSMPSWDLFEQQAASYRELVLPNRIRARVGVWLASRLRARSKKQETDPKDAIFFTLGAT